ncbi:MAG: T9SS type A sorting domain-containing protein [Bacteroidota bacterium]|nr:T9SS type A sorting domain-containing protein [Bacteroidota bacterium]
MKNKIFILMLLILGGCVFAAAQDVEHPWSVQDRGGGNSNSPALSLTASLGQSVIDAAVSDTFILQSGYIPPLVEVFALFTLCVHKEDVSCSGSDGSISATGMYGVPPYQYSLDKENWQSDGNFAGLPAGVYTVFATSGECTTQASVTINQPNKIIQSIVQPDTAPHCYKPVNVLCVAVNGDVNELTFNWTVTSDNNDWIITDGSNTNCVVYTAGSGMGTFIVVATEEGGCSDTAVTELSCYQIAEGCSPGFWKNSKQYWDQPSDNTSLCVKENIGILGNPFYYNPATGITTQLYRNVFGLTALQIKAVKLKENITMSDAISLGGGGFAKLARHSVAALLNSCALNGFPFTPIDVLVQVQDAFISKIAEPLASRLDTVNNLGCPLPASGSKTENNQIAEMIPTDFNLHNCYPNPFNPSTTIGFDIPEPSFVHLSIYNILGQEVAVLVDEISDAGSWYVEWSTNTSHSSGVYIYKIQATSLMNGQNYTVVKKMILMK